MLPRLRYRRVGGNARLRLGTRMLSERITLPSPAVVNSSAETTSLQLPCFVSVGNISFSQKAIFQPAVETLVKFSNLANSLPVLHGVFA